MTRNLKRKYEKLIEDLSRDADERYTEYMLEQPRTMVRDNLIFDLESLDSYYNCEGCKKRKPKAFCCSSHDLELTRQDLAVIEKHLPAVKSSRPRLERTLDQKSCWTLGENFEKIMRQKPSGDCVFLMPGAAGCHLHCWALDNSLDPIDVKPYVCSLYPLVVIIIGEDVVITTMNKMSARILDCGEHSASCTARRGRPENHTVLQSQGIMVRMFGQAAYQALHDRIFNS